MRNVSRNLQILIYPKDQSSLLFVNDVQEYKFPSNCTKWYLELGGRFFYSSTAVYNLKSGKGWPVDFLNCEATNVVTMCPKEQ